MSLHSPSAITTIIVACNLHSKLTIHFPVAIPQRSLKVRKHTPSGPQFVTTWETTREEILWKNGCQKQQKNDSSRNDSDLCMRVCVCVITIKNNTSILLTHARMHDILLFILIYIYHLRQDLVLLAN